MPPFGRVHGGMSGDSPANLDRARPGFGTNTSTSLHMGVVGGILDVGGYNEPFLSPIQLVGSILRVPDIDAIEEGVVGDIINETWWWGQVLVFFIGLFRVTERCVNAYYMDMTNVSK